MRDRCGYCGGIYEQDRCLFCGHVLGALPHPYLFLAPGVSGDYRTLQEAQQALEGHADGALYIRVDVAVAFGMSAAMLATQEEG